MTTLERIIRRQMRSITTKKEFDSYYNDLVDLVSSFESMTEIERREAIWNSHLLLDEAWEDKEAEFRDYFPALPKEVAVLPSYMEYAGKKIFENLDIGDAIDLEEYSPEKED